MVTIAPKGEDWSDVGEAIGRGATKGYQQRADEMAIQNAIANLPENATMQERLNAITGAKTYSPEAKKEVIKNLVGQQSFEELQRHHKSTEETALKKAQAAEAKTTQSSVDKELLKAQLIANGYPDYEADLFVNSPPSVQNRMAAQHQDLTARGIRQPGIAQPPQGNVPAEQPVMQPTEQPPQEVIQPEQTIQPEQPSPAVIQPAIQENEVPLDKQGYPLPEIPPETTFKEKEAWRTKNQTFNNKELKDLHTKTVDGRKIDLQLNSMREDNNSGELPTGLSRIIIDPHTGNLYPTAELVGVNKQTQRFVKTINDFVSGAKAFFGGRVSNFEVDTFKSRLPSLMNTEEGRRIIIEQMDLMNKLESVWNNEMEKALKHYGRNADYSFIQSVADERTEKSEQQIVGKLNDLVAATDQLDYMYSKPEKYKNATLVQDPNTKEFNAIDKSKVNEAKKRGFIIW